MTKESQHEAIINEDVFNQVQAILNENRREKKVAPVKNIGLLSQILRCKSCDSAMIYSYTRKKAYKYLYYVCLNAQKRGYDSCPTKTIHAQKIENQVIICLREIVKNKNIALGGWESLPFAQQRSTLHALVSQIQVDVEASKIWLTLHDSGKISEFKIDLVNSLKYKPPKEMAVKNEPKMRQTLILAYQIQKLLTDGKIKDLKQVAGWLNISNIKVYLIMNMLMLAPSIQEEIIFSDSKSIFHIPEYKMNEITREISWDKQKKIWQELTADSPQKHPPTSDSI